MFSALVHQLAAFPSLICSHFCFCYFECIFTFLFLFVWWTSQLWLSACAINYLVLHYLNFTLTKTPSCIHFLFLSPLSLSVSIIPTPFTYLLYLYYVRNRLSDSVTRLAIYWTLGRFFKPLAKINLPKSPTFLANFCKGVKIIHFLVKSFLGNFYRHLAIFIWSHCSQMNTEWTNRRTERIRRRIQTWFSPSKSHLFKHFDTNLALALSSLLLKVTYTFNNGQFVASFRYFLLLYTGKSI